MVDKTTRPPKQLMNKRWLYRSSPRPEHVEALTTALGAHPVICSLLVQKGITQFDQAKSYFRPSLRELHDPFVMKDMDKAVSRLVRAIAQKEAILVYGDYDVDGTTAVAMFYGYLKELGATADYYVPDRYAEGYGISMQAVKWAAAAGFKLMVSLDCGIKATGCIQEANALGMDVIVCDHHEPDDELPPAYAILDPKRPDCLYPTKELSGCGVGFKLLQGLTQRQQLPSERLYDYLDLVVVSIACDIVPIVGENRILAHHGLQKLNTTPCPGLQALMNVSNVPPPVSISKLVFSLGPRINAAGRMEHARLAIQLLLATDSQEAVPLAQQLNQQNSLRRNLDSTITEEALTMIKESPKRLQAKTTVLFKEDWHKGVVGIVASRCIEQYYRPTIILTASQGKATGSARSVAGYNVYKTLQACADLLDQYGGHAHAAGLTLALDQVPVFQQRFEEVVARTIPPELLLPPQAIDLPLAFEHIDFKFYNLLRQMAPFGNGNMRSVFATAPVVAQSHSILKEQHLKLYVHQPGTDRMLEAIGFGLAHYAPLVQAQQPFRMVYAIEENNYRGERRLQLNIKDLKPM